MEISIALGRLAVGHADHGACRGRGDGLADRLRKPARRLPDLPLWFWNGPLEKQKTTEIMERGWGQRLCGFRHPACPRRAEFQESPMSSTSMPMPWTRLRVWV